jgi:hypothetical protein
MEFGWTGKKLLRIFIRPLFSTNNVIRLVKNYKGKLVKITGFGIIYG